MIERKASRLWNAVRVSLLLLALVWTALHVNWQAEGSAAILSASAAAGRAGERVPVMLPKGEVRVNVANVDELCALRGIGPSLARAIIAEREANGAFAFPEDLLGVKGIGPKTLAGFIGQICLE